MIIKILLKTPKGKAAEIEKKVRPYIIGIKIWFLNKKREDGYERMSNGCWFLSKTNEEGSKCIWMIDGEVRKINPIIRRLAGFNVLMKSMMSNKMVQDAAKLTDAQRKELKEMLLNQTEVKLIRHGDDETL